MFLSIIYQINIILNEKFLHLLQGIFEYNEIKTLETNLDTYINTKIQELDDTTDVSRTQVLTVILSSGKKMIEINELQNRDLVRRQMNKVEEILSTAYTTNTLKFLTLLNKKIT